MEDEEAGDSPLASPLLLTSITAQSPLTSVSKSTPEDDLFTAVLSTLVLSTAVSIIAVSFMGIHL